MEKDFTKWKPNIVCVMWSNERLVLSKRKFCPDKKLTGGQKQRGDCSECSHFMGIDFIYCDERYWGKYFDACCWLLLLKDLQEEKETKKD